MQDPPRGFRLGGNVPSNRLVAGMKLAYEYDNWEPVRYFIEVLGFTGWDQAYGKGGVKFASVKEVLAAEGVRGLKALGAKQNKNEYGHGSYMVAHDLQDGSEGAWFYLYQGKWARGSGVDQCLFYRLES